MKGLFRSAKKGSVVKFSKSRLDQFQVDPLNTLPTDQLFFEDVSSSDHVGSRFVLREKNPWRLLWSAVVCALLVYTTSIFLFRFTFYDFHIGPDGHSPLTNGVEGWTVMDWMVDIFFWCDLVLMFFFSFSDEKGREVDCLKRIAINYLSSFFWINLLACMPPGLVSVILQAFAGGPEPASEGEGLNSNVVRVYRLQQISRMTRIARVARLVRTARLMKFLAIFKSTSFWAYIHSFRGLRILKFFAGLMWLVHVLACGMYLCAALHDDVHNTWVARRDVDAYGHSLLHGSPSQQWMCSMYFVLTVFSTVGFGDISAITEGEICYVAFVMLVGAVAQSVIIGEVIGVVTSQDEMQKQLQRKELLIENYSKHTQLTPDITKELKNEIAWRSRHWATSQGFDKAEMKSLLIGHVPRWLMAKMPKSLWSGALLKNDLFTKVGRDMLQVGATIPARLPCLLAMHLVMCEFSAGETIYQLGDFPFTLFLVVSGTFAHVGLPEHNGGVDAMLPEEEEEQEEEHVESSRSLGTTLGGYKQVSSQSVLPENTNTLFPYRLFSQKSYFGDTELIWGKPRFATTRCERDGVALTLHKENFLEVQEMFPQFKVAWAIAARRRERLRAHCLGKLRQGVHYKRLAAMSILQLLRSRYRVTRRSCRTSIKEVTSSVSSLYITGLQPASEALQTQAALEKLNAKMELVLDALRLDKRAVRWWPYGLRGVGL